MKHGLFYGSLRNGHGNARYFRIGKPIKTFTLNDHALYGAGCGYPWAAEEKGGKLVVELHELDEERAEGIRRMEIGAGYHEKEIEVDGITASLYLWPLDAIKKRGLKKVEDGDWSKHKGIKFKI